MRSSLILTRFKDPQCEARSRAALAANGHVTDANKKGSSRFTGERCFDFQEEVSVIPVSIGH
ncbi:hypothetical protein ACUNJC_23940, partial [Serratia sp. IR-2025]